ncbi:MAG: phosphodiester glycosidase family protein [Lentisphaerae bacterium]|nr:phosphodiester glycosidase family protein [Lentisphaerota bacterium]
MLSACTLCLVGCTTVAVWGPRPPRRAEREELFPGVVYEREATDRPVRLMIHAIEIDLAKPGIEFLVTPGDRTRGMEARAMTTSEFLSRHHLQIAVNGSYFSPFRARLPWDYYPHTGDPVDIHGLAISNGDVASPDNTRHPKLCFVGSRAQIVESTLPTGTTQALAAGPLLLRAGRVLPKAGGKRHPRTAVGISGDGQRLWLVVVDGRQGRYSKGVTMRELAEIMLRQGAVSALNLDGGGSTTLVVARSNGTPRVLNSPIHTGICGRQRPVANHLGIRVSHSPAVLGAKRN